MCRRRDLYCSLYIYIYTKLVVQCVLYIDRSECRERERESIVALSFSGGNGAVFEVAAFRYFSEACLVFLYIYKALLLTRRCRTMKMLCFAEVFGRLEYFGIFVYIRIRDVFL